MSKDIRWFKGEYDFLSNFYQAPVTYDGITYDSSECAFQAQKTLDNEVRKTFQHMTPAASKKAGRRVQLRDKWDDIKGVIMLDIVRQKFLQHPDLAEKLLATGDGYLEEGNNWGDRYFGVVNGVGENVLGCSLMIVREELKKRKQGIVPKEVHLCNIALIPNFPVYLDNLDKWMGEDYNREFILHNSNIKVGETEFGTIVCTADPTLCTAHEAWGLFMKCLSIGRLRIDSIEELEEFLKSNDVSLYSLIVRASEKYDVVADILNKTQGHLVHTCSELEKAISCPEYYIRSWLSNTLDRIVSDEPRGDYTEWEHLIDALHYDALIMDDEHDSLCELDVEGRDKKMKRLCEILDTTVNSYVDAFVDACGFYWLDRKYSTIRRSLYNDIIKSTLGRLSW